MKYAFQYEGITRRMHSCLTFYCKKLILKKNNLCYNKFRINCMLLPIGYVMRQ